MPTNYGKHLSAGATPQTQPLPGREAEMQLNAAGGYAFRLDSWLRLQRFLILGCEGGTYYESERKLTIENAKCILECLAAGPVRLVSEIVEVSDKALAPKNDPAIFALALISAKGDAGARMLAYEALPKVCRIPTHLFTFLEYHKQLGGGWGNGMKRAVQKWYHNHHPIGLVNQVLKYQQRNGWANRDALRLAHPKSDDEAVNKIFDAVCRPAKWQELRDQYPLVDGWLKLQEGVAVGSGDFKAWSPKAAANIIALHKLPRELVPTELLTSPVVWEALLPNLGYTALLRNLGNLSKCGLLKPLSAASTIVTNRLLDSAQIKACRVHPWQVLLASRTYSQGRGFRGKGEWLVDPATVSALDHVFECSFQNVQPTNKRFILGIDVSGSMSMQVQGSPITAAEAAAAMAMITIRTEPYCYAFGFAHDFRDLNISARDSLDNVLYKTRGMNFGSTDCAVPIQWAMRNGIAADAIMIYTDGETYYGLEHASESLKRYRQQFRVQTKLGLVAFTATPTTLADPEDRGSMNFVGLDAGLPAAISQFIQE